MTLRLNKAKQRLAEGKPVTMMVVTMPSVAHAQLWSRCGIDVLIFDMEHGVVDLSSLHAMIAATAGSDTIPMVRVPWNVHWIVKPVLDAGALGIMFPLVATAEDAKAAVRAMHYPPKGERGWGPFMTQYRWGMPQGEYVEIANEEIFTIIQIERPEAIENIHDILRVDGVDMFVVSRHDLSTSMGKVASPTHDLHPEVQARVDSVERAVLDNGAPMGGLARSVAQAKDCLARGYKGLIIGFDWMLIERSAHVATDIRRELLS